MYVYLITNTETGKYYVGQTMKSDATERWKQHITAAKQGKGSRLGQAIRKYGHKKFEFEVLCMCPNQEALNETEKFFIRTLATNKESFGYNSTSGGDHDYELSEEVKRNIYQRNIEKKEYKPEVLVETVRYVVTWAGCLMPLANRMFDDYDEAFDLYESLKGKDSLRLEQVDTVLVSRKIFPEPKYFQNY